LVEDVKTVNDANEEILALNTIDPAKTAVIDGSAFATDGIAIVSDSTATIEMEHKRPYNPDHRVYKSHAATEQLAVFSEVYYEPDWRAYIDGKPAEYMRADYILRAMVIPAGDHVIEFKNEAPLYFKMNIVTIVSSIVLVVLAGGAIFMYYRKRKKA
jgi:uncharacterized membrane protein YfhO